jgi:hypothetical protein
MLYCVVLDAATSYWVVLDIQTCAGYWLTFLHCVGYIAGHFCIATLLDGSTSTLSWALFRYLYAVLGIIHDFYVSLGLLDIST